MCKCAFVYSHLTQPEAFSFHLQSYLPLREMHSERSACFPSFTKTGGMETALHLTPQQSDHGVQLKQNLNVNSGDTAQPLVSLSNFNITGVKM